MQDLEQYRTPNGLIGVTFAKRWNAYQAGQMAGFADQQALALRDAGLVVLRKYTPPEPRRQVADIGPIGPIRGRMSADHMNTANVRRPGEAGPAPEDPERKILRQSGLTIQGLAESTDGGREIMETYDPDATRASLGDYREAAEGNQSGTQGGEGGEGNEDPRGSVEIPSDWEEVHFQTKLKIARDLGAGDNVTTKDAAEAIIREELDRRKAAE